jgi:hypothetical protein
MEGEARYPDLCVIENNEPKRQDRKEMVTVGTGLEMFGLRVG